MAIDQPNLIDLRKKVDIILMKRSAPKICAQVSISLDVSGSAQGLFSRGVMHNTVQRVFPLAMKFDDNATLDAFVFGSNAQEAPDVKESMFGDYVNKHILNNSSLRLWSGTNYSPLLRLINDRYKPSAVSASIAGATTAAKGILGKLFGKATPAPEPVAPAATGKAKPPAYAIIVTDGDNGDETATETLFEEFKDAAVYYQFIGISDPGSGCAFRFLQRMADKYDNVGFFNANQIENMSDEDLYGKLLNREFIEWYKAKTGA
jgi:hypothetical protein